MRFSVRIAIVIALMCACAATQDVAWTKDNAAAQQAVSQGRLKDAERNFRAAAKDAESANDVAHLCPTLANLAAVYINEKQYPDAEQAYNKALQAAERKGADDPLQLVALDGLMRLYVKMNKLDQSIRTGERALALREKLVGSEDTAVATTALALANIYYGTATSRDIVRGSLSQGPDPYNQSPILAGSMGSSGQFGNSSYASTVGGPKLSHAEFDTLGSTEESGANKEKLAKAEALYKRADAIYEKTAGPDSGQVALTLEYLGRTYAAEKKYPDAEATFQKVLGMMEKSAGSDSAQLCPILGDIELVDYARADYPAAEAIFKRDLQIRENTYGADGVQLVPTLRQYSELLDKMKRKDDAKEMKKRAEQIEKAQKRG